QGDVQNESQVKVEVEVELKVDERAEATEITDIAAEVAADMHDREEKETKEEEKEVASAASAVAATTSQPDTENPANSNATDNADRRRFRAIVDFGGRRFDVSLSSTYRMYDVLLHKHYDVTNRFLGALTLSFFHLSKHQDFLKAIGQCDHFELAIFQQAMLHAFEWFLFQFRHCWKYDAGDNDVKMDDTVSHSNRNGSQSNQDQEMKQPPNNQTSTASSNNLSQLPSVQQDPPSQFKFPIKENMSEEERIHMERNIKFTLFF
ncbi:hypothetical protein RFI_27825, partial [Reticulomyxa filosa]